MLKRTAKSCGSDAPRLASSFAEASRPNRALTKPYPQDDGGKTAWSPRRARRKPLKPLRGECRLNPSEPVVTMLVCFVLFRTRGCGCSEHPAFPAPSVSLGERFLQDSDASRREIAKSYLKFVHVIARSEATKQSTLLFKPR